MKFPKLSSDVFKNRNIPKLKIRVHMTQGLPVKEIVVRSVPSDLSKIAFISQLLSLTDTLAVRYNFVEERMSFVTFSDETTDHVERVLHQHAIEYERADYVPHLHSSMIVLSSSPQFQFTKYNNIVSLQQEEIEENKAEFLEKAFSIIMDQLSQSMYHVDFMLRMRKLPDEELSDIRTQLHHKFRVMKKDASSKYMASVDGVLVDHRMSMDVVNFGSVGTVALLQNQEEDLLGAQSVYAYEIIVLAHQDALMQIESIMRTLPNSIYERKHNIAEERIYEHIPSRMLYDGTFSVASANSLAKYVEFDSGKLAHVRESVLFKIPPRQVFAPTPNSNTIDIIIGQIDKAKHKAVIKAKNEHMLVTGSTGSGKTNGAMIINEQLIREGVKLLILEPAKSEWYNIAGFFDMTDHGVVGNTINVICLGSPEKSVGLLFNPFAVPEGVSVDSHIQHIDNAFVVAFGESLTEPQYSVLTDCTHILYELYEEPCFSDLIDVIDQFNDPRQAGESLTWVKQALIRKLTRFTHGSIGHCFNVRSGLTPTELINNNFVVNLSWLKDEQMKGFIVASLLSSCVEYLEANGSQQGVIKNKICIEEAHRIFPSIPPHRLNSKEGASVKVIAEMLKEVRAFDTAVDIYDQSPSAVFKDAVLNTAVKIAFRVADGVDKKTLEESMMLTEEQAMIMPGLEPGRCFIHNPSVFADPYMVKFERSDQLYLRRLQECGVRNPVPLDPNIKNLSGRTISDKRIAEVAQKFYTNTGIEWRSYDGEEFAKSKADKERLNKLVKLQQERLERERKSGLKSIDESAPVKEKEAINFSLPVQNIDEVLTYLDYVHFSPIVADMKQVVAAVIRNHTSITCKSEFHCAANVSSFITKESDFSESIAPDVIGRVFLKLIDCGVLIHRIGEDNHGFVCVRQGFDMRGVGISPKDVRWDEEEKEYTEPMGIEEEPKAINEITPETLENVEEGIINSVNWILGTNDGERILYTYVQKANENHLSDIYAAYIGGLAGGGISRVFVSGPGAAIEKIRNEIPVAMASSNEVDYLKFISLLHLKSVAE